MTRAIYIVFAVLAAWVAATIYFTSSGGSGWFVLLVFLGFNLIIFLTICVRNGASFRRPLPQSTLDRVWRIGVRAMCGVFGLAALANFTACAMSMTWSDLTRDAGVVLLPFVLYAGLVAGMLVYFAVAPVRPARTASA